MPHQTEGLGGEANPLRATFADYAAAPEPQAYQPQHAYLPPEPASTTGINRRAMMALGGSAAVLAAIAGAVPLLARRGQPPETQLARQSFSVEPQAPSPISAAMLEASEAIEYIDLESQEPSFAIGQRLSSLEPHVSTEASLPTVAAPSLSTPLPTSKPLGINNKAERFLAIQRSLSKPASIAGRPALQQFAYAPQDKPTLPARPADTFDLDAAISSMLQEFQDTEAQVASNSVASNSVASKSPASAPKRLNRPSIVTSTGKLRLRNAHTGEALAVTLKGADGQADRGAAGELKHFMRDWRTGDVGKMDARLYELMAYLGSDWGRGAEMVMISGYRSPKTNSMLASKSGGVAKKSYHMLGKAIDFRLSGRSLKETYHQALRMNAGGVGYYPGSNFIHMDTGPVREWPAKYKQYAQTYRKQSLA